MVYIGFLLKQTLRHPQILIMLMEKSSNRGLRNLHPILRFTEQKKWFWLVAD